MTLPKIYAIKIKLPFLLKWTKRFIKTEISMIEQKEQLVGKNIDQLIIDDNFTTPQEAKAYADKLLKLKS